MGIIKFLYCKGTCESEDIKAFKTIPNISTLKASVAVVNVFDRNEGSTWKLPFK